MNRVFQRLPLLPKLLLIAIVPILFIIFLTINLYREKSGNLSQLEAYLKRINQSATITKLIDQLQRERRYSFDYALQGTHQVEMLAQRPKTDSLLASLERNHDRTLKGFMAYTFLSPIDSIRALIDTNAYAPNQVMHFYSNAVFRFSTLNSVPTFANQFVMDPYDNLNTQKILSEIVTYEGIISANIYNILYTREYVIETLLGTLPSYNVLKMYEKELSAKAHPNSMERYQALRQRSAVKPVVDYMDKVFSSFSVDSTFTPQQWSDLTDEAMEDMREFQMSMLTTAEEEIQHFYQSEKAGKTRAIVMVVSISILLLLLAIYLVSVISQSLSSLRRAALQIADGKTDIHVRPESNDAIGSLASSIITINEKNKELARAAEKIGQGDFSFPLTPRSDDDVLSNAIIQMRESLRRSMDDLRTTKEEFVKMAELMPQIVWTADVNGNITYYNNRWHEITGIRPGLDDTSWIPILHPDDVGHTLRVWYNCLEHGTPYEIEYRFRDVRSKDYRWFLGRAVPVRDSAGNIAKWFGTATDIHDQKMQNEKLEELVSRRTVELSRSNDDLRQFAHVASHDLKEPLRKIRTFSNRLAVEFGEMIPPKGRTYIAKLENSSARMSNMIESILNYSVINATEQSTETVDLNRVMEGIMNDLELLILQKEARIIYHNLPKIKGVSTLIYQLFYNIVCNSLKFSKENTEAVIKVSSQKVPFSEVAALVQHGRCEQYHHVVIEDNGIGFNQEYAEKMFDVFTRLNGHDQYEGTGLGLALCKRIVFRHNGAIYANGEENVGAAFHILLPDC